MRSRDAAGPAPAAAAMTGRLRATDVWAAPPGVQDGVLRGFTLELAAGEWIAISGPNGCGKTTLALVLAGLWAPQRGRVELDGVPVHAKRREIAVVLQDPANQMITASVRDELAATARNLGMAPESIDPDVSAWTGAFGLADELGKDPRTLSAGRQQLVLLAAAMIARPSLLIADEPLVHVEPALVEIALERIRAAVRRGLSVIWISQSGRERAAADRAIAIGESGEAGARPPSAPNRPAGERAVRIAVGVREREDLPVVRNAAPVAIDLPRRGIVCLTGPNGCGKSALLSAATGLIDSPQFQLTWEVPPTPPPLMSAQFPEQQIFEESVRDEVLFAAVSRGLDPDRALAAAARSLEILGLDPESFFARRCWWLSGGERRIVSVVSALIAPASLLALDEPTAGLDPRRRQALGSLVEERSEQGPTLVATQDREWALSLGGQILDLGLEPGFGLPNLSKKMD